LRSFLGCAFPFLTRPLVIGGRFLFSCNTRFFFFATFLTLKPGQEGCLLFLGFPRFSQGLLHVAFVHCSFFDPPPCLESGRPSPRSFCINDFHTATPPCTEYPYFHFLRGSFLFPFLSPEILGPPPRSEQLPPPPPLSFLVSWGLRQAVFVLARNGPPFT